MNVMGLLSWFAEHAALGTLAGIAWVIRSLGAHEKTISKHEYALYGEDGSNGLRGTVKELRDARHLQASTLQDHTFKIMDHDRRILTLESSDERGVA